MSKTAVVPTSLPASSIPWTDPRLEAAIRFCPQIDSILAKNFRPPDGTYQINEKYTPSDFKPQCFGEWQPPGTADAAPGILGGATFDLVPSEIPRLCRADPLSPALLKPLAGMGNRACIYGAAGRYHVMVILSENHLLHTFVETLNNGVPDATARADVIAMAKDLIRIFRLR